MRTELTFTVWPAPAAIELEYPGDEGLVLPAVEPLPDAEPLPVALPVELVPLAVPVVPVVLEPLGLDADAEAEAPSRVPVISTL
jgi:hypothetical protein